MSLIGDLDFDKIGRLFPRISLSEEEVLASSLYSAAVFEKRGRPEGADGTRAVDALQWQLQDPLFSTYFLRDVFLHLPVKEIISARRVCVAWRSQIDCLVIDKPSEQGFEEACGQSIEYLASHAPGRALFLKMGGSEDRLRGFFNSEHGYDSDDFYANDSDDLYANEYFW